MGNNGKLLEKDFLSGGSVWSRFDLEQEIELLKIFRDQTHPWMNE